VAAVYIDSNDFLVGGFMGFLDLNFEGINSYYPHRHFLPFTVRIID
jgi:hypothetical protein